MLESEKGKNLIVKHACAKTCKYHRVPGKEFDINHLGPSGLCLDLYFAAYPYCLGLLHGAEFSWMKNIDGNKVYAQCPAPESVHFEVSREKLENMVINEGVKKNLKIKIKITEIEPKSGKYENDCLCTPKVGQEFEFNQGDFLDYLCPAAFYNLYPTVKTLINGGRAPWVHNGKIYAQCPDNLTKILFEIKNG